MARPGYKSATYMWQGKRKYCYAKTYEEARKKADIALALRQAGVKEKKDNTTVSSWARKWLRDYKQGAVSDAWYKQTEGILDNHIFPYIGDKRIADVTAADIKRLMNKKSHFSESHQRKIAQTITQIFDSAVENDVIDKLPIHRIKIATRSRESSTRAITDEERNLTLKVADKYPDLGMQFLLMLYCGLRPQEVARVKMGDYDRESQILHIRRARKADGTTDSPKSKSGNRDIPVPNYLAERLNKIDKKKTEYICTSKQGHPLTRSSQKRAWNRFKRLMDIENGAELFRNHVVESTLADDLRPYCYRHTYCTDLQDAEVPITVAQRLMGHSDIKMTAQIYTHHSQKSFEDARNKIERFHIDK